MHKWELAGRFEWADTREAAAVLLGATDPNEVRFAGYCVKPESNMAKWNREMDRLHARVLAGFRRGFLLTEPRA